MVFKKGNKVKCVTNFCNKLNFSDGSEIINQQPLTIGKEYIITRNSDMDNFIFIIDDEGKEFGYQSWHFLVGG